MVNANMYAQEKKGKGTNMEYDIRRQQLFFASATLSLLIFFSFSFSFSQ